MLQVCAALDLAPMESWGQGGRPAQAPRSYVTGPFGLRGARRIIGDLRVEAKKSLDLCFFILADLFYPVNIWASTPPVRYPKI